MKTAGYVAILFFLIPFQTTIMGSLSPMGLYPDLCLITVCLVGYWAGRTEGLIMGFILGFSQDLLSAGNGWLNTVTKPGVGFLSAILARNMANSAVHSIFLPMLLFSIFSGVIFFVSSRTGVSFVEILYGFRAVLLPQALIDSLLAVGCNWIITRRHTDIAHA